MDIITPKITKIPKIFKTVGINKFYEIKELTEF